ncbi:MAG: hypothetical protein NZM37_09635, partial [Sandaracinaceae bacterium]|nr:hypothetical protein [Sandaracinaceae bacterium]
LGIDGVRQAHPIPVPGLSEVRAIAVGANHSCAIRRSGELLCWGRNDESQIGVGSVDPTVVRSPTPVRGLPPVQSISLGRFHSCALTRNAQIWCWGGNNQGQLGTGTIGGEMPAPTRVTGL